MKCKICESYAINPHLHGREQNIDLDLCDVCYWRKRAKTIKDEAIIKAAFTLRQAKDDWEKTAYYADLIYEVRNHPDWKKE